MSASRIRLLTFDFTDTLAFFNAPRLYARELERTLQLRIDEHQLSQSLHNALNVMQSANFGAREPNSHQFWHQVVDLTVQPLLSTKHSDRWLSHKTQVADALIEQFSSANAYQLFDGVKESLMAIKKLNVPMAVLSNNDERLETILQELQIRSFFEFVQTSRSANAQKPCERFFRAAYRSAVQTIDASLTKREIVHVGDHKRKDYDAARDFGFRAIWIDAEHAEQRVERGALPSTLKNLTQLPKIVALQNKQE